MPLDVTTLKMAVDSTDLARAVTELHKVQPAARSAEQAVGRIGPQFASLGSQGLRMTGLMTTGVRELAGAFGETGAALVGTLADVLAGFGGVALSALVSIGVPLVDLFIDSGNEAGTLADRLDDLDVATRRALEAERLQMGGVEALIARYGQASEAVRALAADMARVASDDAAKKVADLIGDTFQAFTDSRLLRDVNARAALAAGDLGVSVTKLTEGRSSCTTPSPSAARPRWTSRRRWATPRAPTPPRRKRQRSGVLQNYSTASATPPAT